MTYKPHQPQKQVVDSGNTQTITAVEAQPANPWVGTWTETRDADFVRILTVLAATDATVDGLGGIFTFEFSEDAVTATVSETRPIGDFSTVRDFDLINAGAYYRVQFEPDRALAGDSVFLTTTLRKQDDGAFVRLADQIIEQQNAAMAHQFAFPQAFDLLGKSANRLAGGMDPLNSSQANLGSAGSFTGTYRRLSGFEGARLLVVADKELESVALAWSSDGISPRTGPLATTEAAGVEGGDGLWRYNIQLSTLVDAWGRVEVVNTTGATTTFDCNLWLKESQPAGSFTNAGLLLVADFESELARGLVPGATMFRVSGRNPDIDTGSVPEDVWAGGDFYTGQDPAFPDDLVAISSDDLNDTALGTGAQTVELAGLRADGSFFTEELTMAGLTAVVSLNSYTRVLWVRVLTAGSNGNNVGTLTIRRNPLGDIFAEMPPDRGRTQVGAFTVPAIINGKAVTDATIQASVSISLAGGSSGSAQATLRARPNGGAYEALVEWEPTTGNDQELIVVDVLEPLTDVKVTIDDVSTNNTIAVAQMKIVAFHPA